MGDNSFTLRDINIKELWLMFQLLEIAYFQLHLATKFMNFLSKKMSHENDIFVMISTSLSTITSKPISVYWPHVHFMSIGFVRLFYLIV